MPPPWKLSRDEVKLLEKKKAPKRANAVAGRSVSSSPAMTALGSAPKTTKITTSPSPATDPKTVKLHAIRIPLIHLLAVRPVSERFLSSQVGCTQQECLDILNKIGQKNTIDSSKWDLSDKGCKDLDIWKFPYPTDEDRQFAIDRAVKAFDRLRLARSDDLWQKLLPQKERGQGKVISKLQLGGTGPVQHVAPPRINIQSTGDAKLEAIKPGDESDRNDRLDPTRARSQSRDAVQKSKTSQKDSLTKRLLSKNPKASQATKARDAQPSAKKGSKKATANAHNANIKSAEFVHDSDEETEDVDSAPTKANGILPLSSGGPTISKLPTNGVPSILATTKTPEGQDSKDTDVPPITAAVAAKKAIAKKPVTTKANATKSAAAKPTVTKSVAPKPLAVKPTNTNPAAAAAKSAAVKAAVTKPPAASPPSVGTKKRISEASRAMNKSLSRQQSSRSPFKPSPLGSSPPTNASDLEIDGLGLPESSSSSTPLISQSRPVNGSTPTSFAGSMRPAPKSVADGSAMLKRKANDIDSGIHDHVDPRTVGGRGSSPKRQKTSMSPPTSNPSTVSSRSTSDSPTAANHHDRLMLAQNFKTDYAIYERLYKEVYAWRDAPTDKIKEVLKMHERLLGMKHLLSNGTKD